MKKLLLFLSITICVLLLIGCSAKALTAGAHDDFAPEEEAVPIEVLDTVNLSASSSRPTQIVVVLWDGAANEKTINNVYNIAKKKVPGWSRIKGVWLPGFHDIGDAKKEIDKIVRDYNKNPSELLLLLVGKSMGGAKTYKMLYNHSSAFDDFYRTAVVLIDSHEPVAPGKYGRADYWYDYVIFRRNSSSWRKNYDLKWQTRWNSFGSKLAIYNTYQRKEWPQGYSFSSARENTRIYNEDHFSIVECPASIQKMEKAFKFLLQ